MMKKILLYLISFILLFAVIIQLYSLMVRPDITKEGKLEDLISTHLPGWRMEELPLGETEEVQNAVENQLRFDDVVSRVYQNGDTQVGVYIAYWEPGKMPVRLVGVHTPDTCWVQNGWTCTARESNLPKSVGGEELKPAEYGIYETDMHLQHVLFWHIVGSRIHTYEQQGMHSLTAAWQDIFRYGLNQRQEQYFIRISSNRPFDEFWDNDGFRQLMEDVAGLGLMIGDAPSTKTDVASVAGS
ncbi:MAG: exosortase-associated EpsI family protein [Opitutales bacterium]